MSRLAKKPIIVPDGVQVSIKNAEVAIKGSKGELKTDFSKLNVVIKHDQDLFVEKDKAGDNARWGLAHALLKNMVIGVSSGFSKTIEIHGVGYKAAVNGRNLKLDVGFSHSVELELPEGIEAKVQKNQIIFSGANNIRLGDFAAKVRKIRPPEPYKGRGLRYLGEYVRHKEGKKAVGEGTAAGGSA